MISVSVVIVTYNAEPWIHKNLSSLQQSTLPVHIIVVDNASTDATVQILNRDFPNVEVICQPANLGFGGGNNIGIARSISRGDRYIFLLNQDAYITEKTVEELAGFMDRHENFGIASPLHCSPNLDRIDRKTYQFYLHPFALPYLSDAMLGKVTSHYRIRGINAAAWFVRTSVFVKIGGFDPIYFMYGEDDDLLSRFEKHDIPFALLPSSRIVHLRESPATNIKPSYWNDVKKRAAKERTRLIRKVKNPDYSGFRIVLGLAVDAVTTSFSDILIAREMPDFVAKSMAIYAVIREIKTIMKHAHMCSELGPHFLSIDGP